MIDITLQELKIFELLLRTGSITTVAEVLKLSKPTCTRNIASLEKKLGRKLFLRVNNEFKLTNDAVYFYGSAFRLLQSSQNIFSPDFDT
ncbi:LysR family transcriptional regulator, partial [Facilibium subflavum]|uniref:LysR family transcriptional regulator n=1 Tax=Facilibium subflavum TaxID=2219058 RepID=UPI0013C31C91